MDRERIITWLGDDWTKVQSGIRGALTSDICLLNVTNESIMSHSGKMLRPLLALLFARACGDVNDESIRFAAASEILHNATLLHDDVADNSLERRGEPTVNSFMGSRNAVLVGDFWLAKAVEVVIGASRHRDQVISFFTRTLTDLAEGEMLQLEKASSADTTLDDYFRIIYDKTASLFVATCMSAAVSVDAGPEIREIARQYAKAAGIAFQIKDDILDYAGTDALGKPVGIDLEEQKITLPLLGALQGSEREAEIRNMVKEIHHSPECCETVREFVRERDGVGYATRILDEYIEKAVRSLDPLPDSTAKSYLVELARFNALRNV